MGERRQGGGRGLRQELGWEEERSSTTQDAGTIEQHSLKDYPDSQDIPDDELAEGLAAMLSDSTLIPPEQDISSVPTKALAGNVEWHPELADFLHVVLDQRSPQLIFAIYGGDILALLQAPNVSFLLDRCVFCNEAVQDTEDMWPHLCNPIINSCPKLSLYSLGIMMHQFIGHCKTFYIWLLLECLCTCSSETSIHYPCLCNSLSSRSTRTSWTRCRS